MEMLRTDDLHPISLEALNAAASLLTRVDRKYLVPAHVAQGLVQALAPRARVLEIEGTRSFSYASTYFDTPGLESYLAAARKRRRRFKVRTRSYLDSGLTFLEVKTRGARGATVKKRVPYGADDADRLTARGRAFVAQRLDEAGITPASAHHLEPVMATTYARSTLLLPGDDARLTLDTRLAWQETLPDGGRGTRRTAHGLVVVETKNPATPSPADRWLWGTGYRPTTISKYATGMAALHPQLPSNKWSRVLRRELAAA
nr:polyphosphate polymerase domain-containing protein [Actinomyces sp.]